MLVAITAMGMGSLHSRITVRIDSVFPEPVGPMISRLSLWIRSSGWVWLCSMRRRWAARAVATVRTPSSCPIMDFLIRASNSLGDW